MLSFIQRYSLFVTLSGVFLLSYCSRVPPNMETREDERADFLRGTDSTQYSPSSGCFNNLIYRFLDENTALVVQSSFLYGDRKSYEDFSGVDSSNIGIAYFLEFSEKVLASEDSVAFVNYCSDLRVINAAKPKKVSVLNYDLILLHHSPCIVSARLKNMSFSDSISFLGKDVVFWKVDICNVPG